MVVFDLPAVKYACLCDFQVVHLIDGRCACAGGGAEVRGQTKRKSVLKKTVTAIFFFCLINLMKIKKKDM